ncbi:MAG: LuxR family transcriptional regulator [Mycobacteriaceae bacterium]|nr:LuxR family transcriptional regulator [Mycobacteriaceae bacterium]
MSVKSASRGRPPAGADRFVGREEELDRIITLLTRRARLLTLLGSGGVGKTRLAAEVVVRNRRARGPKVYWAGLASIPEGSADTVIADFVTYTVAGADQAGATWNALRSVLAGDGAGRTQRTILVLDNCEHLAEAAGRLVGRLLDEVPELTIMATSRKPVGYADEHRIVVPPLSDDEALDLFRARSALTGHPVAESDTGTAAAICRRLDNHPLHIRLAAARLTRTPLSGVRAELTGEPGDDGRLAWVDHQAADSDVRHQGVRDVIEWSYRLCSDEQRLLLDRMAVFASVADTSLDAIAGTARPGVELDAIIAVCGDKPAIGDSGTGPLPAERVEQVLWDLVDQSLVTAHMTSTVARYSLVESVRVYAARQLDRRRAAVGTEESVLMARRHVEYFRDEIARAATHWSKDQGEALRGWARDVWSDIVTAVLRCETVPGMTAAGLEMCAHLLRARLTSVGGGFRAVRVLAARALYRAWDVGADLPDDFLLSIGASIVQRAVWQGDRAEADRVLADCVARCGLDPDAHRTWKDTPGADLGLPPAVEMAWGTVLFSRADPQAVEVLCRATRKYARAAGAEGDTVHCALITGLVAGFLGSREQAVTLAEQGRAHAGASGVESALAWADLADSVVQTKYGDPLAALRHERAALQRFVDGGDACAASWAVHLRAWTLARTISDAADPNDPAVLAAAVEAAQLLGGASVQRSCLGVELSGIRPIQSEVAGTVRIVRGVLGRSRHRAATQRGATLRPELNEVHDFALGRLTVAQSLHRSQRREGLWTLLTPAEREVAVLAAEGWSNSAVATRRGTSIRTVESQMLAIFTKLGISARGHIANHIPTLS